MTLILLFCFGISLGLARAQSDPATVLEEQTNRRRQEEIDRLAREQAFDSSKLRRKLERFDQKANRPGNATGATKQRRLRRRLNEIRQEETLTQTHREQELRRLERAIPSKDTRRTQELNRLRHRQRTDAFINRQKMRLRQNPLETHERSHRK